VIFEVLYADLTTLRVGVLQAAKLANNRHVLKTDVLGVGLYAEGTPEEIVKYIDGHDSYLLAVNPSQRLVYLCGWDDDEGGWFRINSPKATDGYKRSTIPPYFLPYQSPDYTFYVFRGAMVDGPTWASSQVKRREMARRRR